MWSNPRIPYQLASHRTRLEPLNGKPLLVNVVMNIEYWPFDRPMPRGIGRSNGQYSMFMTTLTINGRPFIGSSRGLSLAS